MFPNLERRESEEEEKNKEESVQQKVLYYQSKYLKGGPVCGHSPLKIEEAKVRDFFKALEETRDIEFYLNKILKHGYISKARPELEPLDKQKRIKAWLKAL